MSIKALLPLLACAVISLAGCTSPEVTLPAFFSDGMVLQQNRDIPVTGTTEPGGRVSIRWQGRRYSTRADSDGRFRIVLNASRAGGPYTLDINGKTISDVLVGKVFLCSGQSNMELPINRCMDVVADEVKDYANTDIRYIKVPLSYEFAAEKDDILPASWEKLENPGDALSWGALCYFLARFMNEEDGVPVGIINSSVGGSPIEAWMEESTLCEEHLRELAECRRPGYVDSMRTESGKVYSEWQTKHNMMPAPEPSAWKSVELFNNSWAVDRSGNNIYGSHFFRNTIHLSADQAGSDATLHLGAVIDADSTFVNGTYVGNTTYRYPPRHYNVPAGVLKEGENTIEIHLYSYHGVPAGFVKEKRYSLQTATSDIPLTGGWQYRMGRRMPERRDEIFLQYKPAGLYNAMIAPLREFPSEGVVWYQGESNCDDADCYGERLMTMMDSWRKQMHNEHLPFYIVELASYEQIDFTDREHGWALVQREQARACSNTDNAYLVHNSDLGEWYDIHPQDKITVARRVADAILRHEKDASADSLWLGAAIPMEGEPYYSRRILNHWDNLDDTVERGYAGHSIWEWTSGSLPVRRIREYGALNQTIGINGTVLNNVNASPAILDEEHLLRVAEIADILRPYGMRVYLSVNFASPSALGGLPTSDPLNPAVIGWWRNKIEFIYKHIPDFGGFLVKASSEGQPGPGDYGRSHAEGANMLADILAPHDGIVMWRAFVYSAKSTDRAMQAYEEFKPLDGQFRDNVTVQVKNGPVDFQPREAVSPLFWAMPGTPLTPELQITQEYLGQSRHLVFLAPMWKECLDVIPGGDAIAGVANIGQDASWCGHIFSQANWYAFGRLAWDPSLSSEQIADEWIRLTFKKPGKVSQKEFEKKFIEPVKDMMLSSREACVDYMMPLGLHHLFAWEHHYGPEPWCDIPGSRPDWMPSYYHKAGEDGIGFDRTGTGSGAADQYPPELASVYNDPSTCPENLLLWFHHLPWDYRMKSGSTLWDEICLHYDRGVKQAREFRKTWNSVRKYVDDKRWQQTDSLLAIQVHDAEWWRDACVQYFQTFSHRDIPAGVEPPQTSLDSLRNIHLNMGNHN